MNPQSMWKELLQAVADKDDEQMDRLSDALLEWVKNRRAPPVTIGDRKLGVEWHSSVTQFVCYLVKSRQRKSRERRNRLKEQKRPKGGRP